jgi:adenylate kinase
MASNNKTDVIILIGPPGAGKGTQLELLQEKLHLDYIGSGELLRERKKIEDFTGKKISQCIDKGNRVPTPVIFYLWMGKLEELSCKEIVKGFIIDGSPRTLYEAEMLDLALGWYEWDKNVKAILIKISAKESIQRLLKRRMCKDCGRIFPYLGEFKHIEKCDECGGELYARPDDTVEGVKKRLAWFKTDVMPAVRYFKKRGLLIEINGEQSVAGVAHDILEAIGQK